MAIMPLRTSKTAMSAVLELPGKSATEQIAALERGLPSSTLNEISALLNLPKGNILKKLKLAQRTITLREKSGKRFTLEESERLLRVLRVRRIVREVFQTDQAVSDWLIAPDASLGKKSPLEMLTTDVGAAKVENLARAMVHGVPI
jgi:putative toxin-antitoxin system antitoxin component (TIGR02293 family)